MAPETDLAIVGGGPAGLTAAIYCARMKLKTTVFEAEKIGGVASTAKLIENYPGFKSISGEELSERMRAQAEYCGANIVFDTVNDLNPTEMLLTTASGEQWKAKAVIIATGSKRQRLGLSNEKDLEGQGISYCAVCDGSIYGNKIVAIVGGENTAAMDTIYLSGLARKVYLIHNEPRLNVSKELEEEVLAQRDLVPMFNCKIEEAISKKTFNESKGEYEEILRKLKVLNLETNETSEIRVKALFIALGEDPFKLAKLAKIETDVSGAIIVNQDQQTNIEGIFAAGDVTGNIKQIGTAVGEGIIAAMKAGFYAKKKIRKNTAGEA
ncbi:MAG: FAD-dependent oxidoreductase [Candidatus Heimdallarchaeota archaeon]|nr:MAG: FAD-dependent oxidoreductase [Candidatus Heimdallarchaeota archaeon]